MRDAAYQSARRQFPDFLVIGGGSNILFTEDVQGVVLKVSIKGIQVLEENAQSVLVRAGAGMPWHDLVVIAIGNNWGGLENLACIPGTVGAAPVQNIGAYGVEARDTIEAVRAYDLLEDQFVTFEKAACAFGYRESFFKRAEKGRYIITAVDFRLNKTPRLQLDYGAIRDELAKQGIETPDIAAVAKVVCAIRASKLPSPAQVGNAGSFFKNPVIDTALLGVLKETYPDMPYHASEGGYKVPAGWLIEKAGWKGYREGDAGCHEKQALVLVNHGSATGNQILALAEKIQASIQKHFGIALEREVQVFRSRQS